MRPRGRRAAGLALAGAALTATVTGGAIATAQDEPSPPEGAASVSGTSTLVGQLDPGVTNVEDGVVRSRGNVLITLEETDDPRASGQAIITVNIDAYPVADGASAVAQVRFGEMRLENEGGAWEGWFTGRLNRSGFTQTYWLAGEGAYDGLTYVVTAGGDGNVWLVDGLIYPGEVPPSGSVNRLPVESPGRDVPAAVGVPAG